LLVTGPYFDSPKLFLQPEGCSREGGSSIQLLDPKEVSIRVVNFLKNEIVNRE